MEKHLSANILARILTLLKVDLQNKNEISVDQSCHIHFCWLSSINPTTTVGKRGSGPTKPWVPAGAGSAPENGGPFFLIWQSTLCEGLFQIDPIEVFGEAMALLLGKVSWMDWVSRKAVKNGEDLLCGSQDREFCPWERGSNISMGRSARSRSEEYGMCSSQWGD